MRQQLSNADIEKSPCFQTIRLTDTFLHRRGYEDTSADEDCGRITEQMEKADMISIRLFIFLHLSKGICYNESVKTSLQKIVLKNL